MVDGSAISDRFKSKHGNMVAGQSGDVIRSHAWGHPSSPPVSPIT
jgi:hypothetical protein